MAGCGGGGHTSSTRKKPTKTATTVSTTTPRTARSLATTRLTETGIASGVPGAKLSANIKVAHGKAVVLRTTLPANLVAHAQQVLVQLSRASATSWKVTASIGRQHATATVTSADGKPMTLVDLGYSCPAPPASSFCPARHMVSTADHTQLQFNTRVPVTVVAYAGPLPSAVTVVRPSKVVVPTYTVKQEVLAETPVKPGAKRDANAPKLAYASTASVHPGDTIVLLTLAAGHLVGAPQPVTVSFPQGPAKTINVSAAIPGGPTSTATLTSASGRPIEVVLPVYRCFVVPAPTVCPPTKVQLSAHRYSFTFNAAPNAPIRLSASAQAG